MQKKAQNWIIALLCVVIAVNAVLAVYIISKKRAVESPNPNVTVISAPEQEDFEVHPEWMPPPVEVIDYGENIALGKEVTQNGHTQIYHSRNTVDGDRFTYWEGMAGSYPNIVTIDMGEKTAMTGARILLNPRQIWGARTQQVEVQVSDDGEEFVSVFGETALDFDPMRDNSAYIPFGDTVEARFVRFVFTGNTEAAAGQAAEIEVYAPKS